MHNGGPFGSAQRRTGVAQTADTALPVVAITVPRAAHMRGKEDSAYNKAQAGSGRVGTYALETLTSTQIHRIFRGKSGGKP
jgi:hypothetical protein